MDDEKIFLPDAVQIDVDGISHFSSNEHAGMNDELFILVAKAGEELLLLPKGLMARWEAAIKAEMGHVKGRRGSELTKQLRELDRERVKMLVNLFDMIRGNRHSPIEAQRKASERLTLKLGRFRRTRRSMSGPLRSVDIESIELHLNELAADVQTLGLKKTADRLHELNERYQAMTRQRTDEALAQKRRPMTELRPLTDEIFAMVRRYVEASYLFAKTDADRAKIYQLVMTMNRVTSERRAGFRESQTKRRQARLERQKTATEGQA